MLPGKICKWILFQETVKTTEFQKQVFPSWNSWSRGWGVLGREEDWKTEAKKGHEPPLLSNEIKWQLLSEEETLQERVHEKESRGGVLTSRGSGVGGGILSSQEIEAITSKLSSGPLGGQEQTNQFGLVLSACQAHRRTPWHPIIGAQ